MSLLTMDIGTSLLTVRVHDDGIQISFYVDAEIDDAPVLVGLDNEQRETLRQFLNETGPSDGIRPRFAR